MADQSDFKGPTKQQLLDTREKLNDIMENMKAVKGEKYVAAVRMTANFTQIMSFAHGFVGHAISHSDCPALAMQAKMMLDMLSDTLSSANSDFVNAIDLAEAVPQIIKDADVVCSFARIEIKP